MSSSQGSVLILVFVTSRTSHIAQNGFVSGLGGLPAEGQSTDGTFAPPKDPKKILENPSVLPRRDTRHTI